MSESRVLVIETCTAAATGSFIKLSLFTNHYRFFELLFTEQKDRNNSLGNSLTPWKETWCLPLNSHTYSSEASHLLFFNSMAVPP